MASNERVTTTPPADKQADVFPRAAAQAKGDEDRAIGNMLGKEETMTAAGQEEVVVVAAEKPAVDKAAVPTAKPVSHEQRVTLDKSPCSGATEKTEEKLVKVLDGIMSSKGKAGVLLKDFSEKLVQQAIAGIDDLGFDEGGEDCSAKTLISMGVRMGAAIG